MTARIKIIVSSLSLAMAAALAPMQPAMAQATSPQMSAGAKVSDTQGGEVGTIISVEGEYVILKTDKHEVRLPASSFTATDKGYLFGLTQAQLNAEAEKAQVDPTELLKAGALVRDPSGALVGSIEAVEGGLATVKLQTLSVNLPVSSFAAGPQGLVIGSSAAELEAQATAAAATTN